jgi:hypothetical protein
MPGQRTWISSQPPPDVPAPCLTSPRNPRIDTRFQHVQRQRAAIEDFVVERADVELAAQFLFARSRSSRIFNSPVLYASAWPGQVM